MIQNLKPGDKVVYTREKFSTSPGRRARNISPAVRGDTYTYEVDKYWTIQSVIEQGKKVIAVTRGGKLHNLTINDPRLRKAQWWELLLFGSRFPRLDSDPVDSIEQPMV